MKIFKILFLYSFVLLFSACEKISILTTDKQTQLNSLDKTLFPLLLTSFMWNSDFTKGKESFSTDQVYGKSFEWVRFRSAIGANNGDASDFCLGVKNTGNGLSLHLVLIKSGHTCDSEQNTILQVVHDLKRVLWSWPQNPTHKKINQIQLDFEWIEQQQWKKVSFSYDLPHFPINQKEISWGRTWRNQQPIMDLDYINPTSIVFLRKTKDVFNTIKLQTIPHTDHLNWQKAQICFAVDDQCQPIISEQCHLCEKGYFTLYNTHCKTHGTSYCGEIRCGQRGQPACYLGQHHIKQDDFKGCSPFTEEWFCHQGLEIKCSKEGAVCY